MAANRLFAYLGAGAINTPARTTFAVPDVNAIWKRPRQYYFTSMPHRPPVASAGFTGSFLYDNIDDVTRVGGGFLRALAQQRQGAPTAALTDPSIRELQLQIAALASQLSHPNRPDVLAHASSSPGAVVTIGAGAGAACLYLAASGVALTDLAWVTRGAFRRASNALATGLKDLSSALQRVREETRAKLAQLATKLDDVDECVKHTAEIASRLEMDIADLHAKVDRVHAAQGVTNAGVRLLCAAASGDDAGRSPLPKVPGSLPCKETDLDAELVALETTLRAIAAP